MMAALWSDIEADVASAKRHFREAAGLYRNGLSRHADYVTTMAFQNGMQAGYTSFEAAMRRVLHLLEEPLPGGEDSHAALVRRLGRAIEGGRPALLEQPLLGHVEELRRFRHVAMHAYDDFAPRRAAAPVEAADAFVAAIDGALTRFRRTVDPGG